MKPSEIQEYRRINALREERLENSLQMAKAAEAKCKEELQSARAQYNNHLASLKGFTLQRWQDLAGEYDVREKFVSVALSMMRKKQDITKYHIVAARAEAELSKAQAVRAAATNELLVHLNKQQTVNDLMRSFEKVEALAIEQRLEEEILDMQAREPAIA